MIVHILKPQGVAKQLECRVLFSVPRHGGYFAKALFTLSAGETSEFAVEAAPDIAVWTVPSAEWDRLVPEQAERLPDAWRDAAARPATPGDEPWVGAIRRGIAERAAWWVSERNTVVVARFKLTSIRVHPTDTSPGVCEQLGRELFDDVVERLTNELCREASVVLT